MNKACDGKREGVLEIVCPSTYHTEREYIINLLLGEFWGLDYRIVWSKEAENKVVFKQAGHTLVLYDGLFLIPEGVWLKEESLPQEPLEKWDFSRAFPDFACKSSCPLLYRAGILSEPVSVGKRCVEFDLDILGSCFFMLTRYEEVVKRDRDGYGRFPVESALAYREGFLEYPIVNEYMEILWAAMSHLFPSIKRRPRTFRLIPTHDLDHPFGLLYESPLQILRHFMGDLLYRKSLSSLGQRIRELWKLHFNRKEYIREKKETYKFLFQISRKHELKDIYFFMNSRCSPLDGNYTMDEPEVKELLQELHEEGHFVGLHPSYASFLDTDEICREAKHANQVLAECTLPPLVGARQHYLRWRNPDTWQSYEDSGISLDSSVGFAGWVGFRSGVCYEYPVFDLCSRQQLKVRELPLIVMDETLTNYMNLMGEAAVEKVLQLAKECRRYAGDFVILWHNTTLDDNSNRTLYQKMIESILTEHI